MVQTLTPHKFSKKEQEQNQIYFDFIKDAIDNYEVKNFAITGAYGTGKSTIIQNFFRLYPTETEDYTHAIVSLSSFCDTSTPSAKEEVIDKPEDTKAETSSPKKENKEREENKTKESNASPSTSSHKPSLAELEMSILQQLFYQIDEKKLRFSRFQRKTKISTSNKIFTFIVSLGCVITLFAFSYKDTFSKYLSSISQLFILGKEDTILFNIIKGIGLFIPALILTIGAYILFERLYYGVYKGHWKKLQFNLGKIQSEHQITGSIINDNLHDILVFFHNAELDVVVFEDIDRLDNAMEIFTKLRELNETINRSHEFQSIKKKVLFIYALKDDILPTPEARTKFFDLIMPIVPLVSSENSYNLFSQELKEIAKKYPQKDFIAINECISDKFLYTVGPYISDIRSIRNIVTEFYIQWKLLIANQWSNIYTQEIKANIDFNRKEVDNFIITESQQLLALMIVKHFIPKDYHLAKDKKGLLHYIFNQGKEILYNFIIKNTETEDQKHVTLTNLSDYIWQSEFENFNLFPSEMNKNTQYLLIQLISRGFLNESYIDFINLPIDGIFSLKDYEFCRKANARNNKDLVNIKIDNPGRVLIKLKPSVFAEDNFLYNASLLTHCYMNKTNSYYSDYFFRTLKILNTKQAEILFKDDITLSTFNDFTLFCTNILKYKHILFDKTIDHIIEHGYKILLSYLISNNTLKFKILYHIIHKNKNIDDMSTLSEIANYPDYSDFYDTEEEEETFLEYCSRKNIILNDTQLQKRIEEEYQ